MKKNTKRTSFFSIVALILCCAMLAGTTLAWFTDSVSNSGSVIEAGNLKVQLSHTNNTDTNKDVTAAGVKLFGDVTLWEPGVAAYETFTVKNIGDMALKYALRFMPVKNADYNTVDYTNDQGDIEKYSLLDVLHVQVLDSDPGTTRPNMSQYAGIPLKDFIELGMNLSSDKLTATNETKDVYVCLYWPNDLGNKQDNKLNLANGRTVNNPAGETRAYLYIDLCVKLIATQVEHEADGFGDNTYDAAADGTSRYASVTKAVTKKTVTAGTPTEIDIEAAPSLETEKTTFSIPADTFDAETTLKAVVEATNAEGSVPQTNQGNFTVSDGETVVSILNLKLYDAKTNQPITDFPNNAYITVYTFISKGLNSSALHVRYNGPGDEPIFISYDPNDGKLTFKTNHFSTFYAVSSDAVCYVADTDTMYTTLEEAIANANGKEITLLKDVTIDSTVALNSATTINGNGKTITATNLNPAFQIGETAVRFENLTLTGAQMGIKLIGDTVNLTLKDCAVNVTYRGICSWKNDNPRMENATILLDNTKINKLGIQNYETETAISSTIRGMNLSGFRNSTVTLQNKSEINGFGYSINVNGAADPISGVADTTGLVVTVKDSTIRGWTSFNVWGSSATYNLINSTVLGVNTSNGSSDNFAAIVFEDDIYDLFQNAHAVNNILNIKDSTITNYQSGECLEQLLRIDCGITQLNLSGNVRFIDTTGNISSVLYLPYNREYAKFMKESIHTDGATITSKTLNDQNLAFAPTYDNWYSWLYEGKIEGCNENLDILFDLNCLCDGEFIDLIDNAVLTGNKTATLDKDTGSFTFKFHGYTVTGGNIILPKGVSVITDTKNTDGVFAAANGAVLTETVNADGTFTYAAQTAVTTEDELKAALASDADTIYLGANIDLTSPLTISKDVTWIGNGNTLSLNFVSGHYITVNSNVNVTFKNVNFANPSNVSNNASCLYAHDYAGTLVIDGCTFTDTQWDSVQITPEHEANITINGCTFTNPNTNSERYVHIEATGDVASEVCKAKITVTNNRFGPSSKVRNSIIDIDYVDYRNCLTVGGNVFEDATVEDGDIFVCKTWPGDVWNYAEAYAAFIK